MADDIASQILADHNYDPQDYDIVSQVLKDHGYDAAAHPTPQPRSRADSIGSAMDALKEYLTPGYMRDTPSSPQADAALANPNGAPGKIGPPSGPSTTAQMIGGVGGDVLADVLPGGLLGKSAAALSLVPGPRAPWSLPNGATQHFFHMVTDAGKKVGYMNMTYDPAKRNVFVDMIDSGLASPLAKGSTAEKANEASQSLGPREIRTLLSEIKRHFPDAEGVGGFRVSGARAATGNLGGAVVPLPKAAGAAPTAAMPLPQAATDRLSTPEGSYRGDLPVNRRTIDELRNIQGLLTR